MTHGGHQSCRSAAFPSRRAAPWQPEAPSAWQALARLLASAIENDSRARPRTVCTRCRRRPGVSPRSSTHRRCCSFRGSAGRACGFRGAGRGLCRGRPPPGMPDRLSPKPIHASNPFAARRAAARRRAIAWGPKAPFYDERARVPLARGTPTSLRSRGGCREADSTRSPAKRSVLGRSGAAFDLRWNPRIPPASFSTGCLQLWMDCQRCLRVLRSADGSAVAVR